MKKNFKMILLQLSAVAVITLLVQGCSKENAVHPKGKPAANYSYDPSSIKSILSAVDQENGTAYSTTFDYSDQKETEPYVRGVVEPHNPGITCYPFPWFCEIIIYGKTSGKTDGTLEGSTVDIIACTPDTPTLYKDVTIISHTVTENGSQTLFEKQH
jgi:hypothetical protein